MNVSKSNSEMELGDIPYVHVKLTKEVLHAFEESTRMSSTSLIIEYLNRCAQEPGEGEGLLTSSSSRGSRRTSTSEESEEEDEDDDYDGDDYG